jgi:hypothetical protein
MEAEAFRGFIKVGDAFSIELMGSVIHNFDILGWGGFELLDHFCEGSAEHVEHGESNFWLKQVFSPVSVYSAVRA